MIRLASAITYGGMGLLFVGLSVPLLLKKIPPNMWYGFRTRLTLGDPEIWYPVNAYGARWLLWIGVATVAAGLGCLWIPESWLAGYALVLSGLWVAALVVALILGVRHAHRLAEND
jgi:hypothetical protein